MNSIINKNDHLVPATEAAKIIKVKPQTLAKWRCTKKEAIPFRKLGRSIWYDKNDLQVWIDSKLQI